jgi:transposase
MRVNQRRLPDGDVQDVLWNDHGRPFASDGLATWPSGHARGDGATGVYWMPVWHILEGKFKLLLANAVQVQALRGRKTDLKDGERTVDLLQQGLLEGSFAPPRPVQQLRDLTRGRTTLKQEQVRIGNRIRKVLEDANINVSSVMSDVTGVSGRTMLRAMVRGECGPEALGATGPQTAARQDRGDRQPSEN